MEVWGVNASGERQLIRGVPFDAEATVKDANGSNYNEILYFNTNGENFQLVDYFSSGMPSNNAVDGLGTKTITYKNPGDEYKSLIASTRGKDIKLTGKIKKNGFTSPVAQAFGVAVLLYCELKANDDSFTVTLPTSGANTTTTVSILDNDTLKGNGVTTSTVEITSNTAPSGITVNSDGKLTIEPNLASGVYTFTYTICEKFGTRITTNCDTATITLRIQRELEVMDDQFEVMAGGATTGTVLDNDKLNGSQVSTASVTLTSTSSMPTGITLDSGTGSVTVSDTVPSGVYTFTYSICEKDGLGVAQLIVRRGR